MPPRKLARVPRLVFFSIALSHAAVAQTPSSVSLSTSQDSIVATITPLNATGRVTFYDGAAMLGTRAVSGGQARIVARPRSTGARFLRAHYSGDGNYSGSDAAIVAQQLNGAIDSLRPAPRPRDGQAPGSYLISTIAGLAMPPTSMPGTSAAFPDAGWVATDGAGNAYFSDCQLNAVLRVDPSGALTRVAGTGTGGFSGDNGPAVNAQLSSPFGVAIDASENLYIVDGWNSRVRRVSPGGTITTVAGGGTNQGDGGPATSAAMSSPSGVAVDASGNLFIADRAGTIRKVNTSGIITTVASNGTAGYSGDNGPATNAQLNVPLGVAVDASGNLFIADSFIERIRKVTPGGIITTVAGIGVAGYSGDGGPATDAELSFPDALALDSAGDLYISDSDNNRIRRVSSVGTITTVAGTGSFGFSGDGGEATAARLETPDGVAADPFGNLYISDGNGRLRKVSAGIINTVAGGGPENAAAAPFAMFFETDGIAKDNSGNVYVSDRLNNRVRMIAPSGSISTVAGTGISGYSGDNGPATAAQLNDPTGLTVDSNGALYIADSGSSLIRKVAGETITTEAGSYPGCGNPGDGGLATSAQLCSPSAVATDPQGNLYIADGQNPRIREVFPVGLITTVAGNGAAGYSGDNGPAIRAQLDGPTGVAMDTSGNLYIADTINNRVRKVSSNGTITTIAGTGTSGFSGDGGPATAALLFSPEAVAVDLTGNVYIADSANRRIRLVAGGIITTIAGGAYTGFGDGDPAYGANLFAPSAVLVDTSGNIYVADTANHLVRLLTPEGGPAVLTVSSTHTGSFPLAGTGQYTLTVSNAALAGPTSGIGAVTEFLPDGLTLSSMSGAGWNCASNGCTRSDLLSPGTSYPSITVSVNVSPTGPSQVTNQVTVVGGGAAMLGAQDLTFLTAPPTTIQTNPAGLQFSLDGLTAQTAPQTLNLSPGLHLIAVPSPQAGAPGTEYAFNGWSDSGADSHPITVTGTATGYTASFKPQYQLTTAALPSAGGSVSPAAGSFFDAGSIVTLTATAHAPYTFSYWSGAASGNSNNTSITMNAPQTATANFLSCDINHDGLVNVADVQLMVNEALGAAPAVDDLNHDGVVNVADIQKLINAVLGLY